MIDNHPPQNRGWLLRNSVNSTRLIVPCWTAARARLGRRHGKYFVFEAFKAGAVQPAPEKQEALDKPSLGTLGGCLNLVFFSCFSAAGPH